MTKADDGLRALLQKHLPRSSGFVLTPLETGGLHSGVPDLHWAHRQTQTSGWLECKATEGWAVEVRPHQVAWVRQHLACGVRAQVAVRARGVGSSHGQGDSLWLLRGEGIAELQDEGLRLPNDHVLGRWHGDPRTWDWAEVTRLLTA